MKPQDSSNLYATLRNNFGAIIFALLIVLYHICKPYYKTFKKLLSDQFNRYTSPRTNINAPISSIEGPDSQYVRIRRFGGSYLIIKCPKLAADIINTSDIFENAAFTSQTFDLSLNLLRVSHERKNFKKLLNSVLRITRASQPCTTPREESLIGDALKNSVEYPIHSNELLGRTKVVIPLSANCEKTPYSPKLYPSLTTNESSDTETRLRAELSSGLALTVGTESTSKMDTNMELLLSERFDEKKQRQAVKECYYNISQPFTLMKVQPELTECDADGRVMNSNNSLITPKSHHPSNTNDKSNDTREPAEQLGSSFLLFKYCIKEFNVLFEAKSNRRETVNVNLFSYRHAVNSLGVCLLGKRISQLTGSRCQFYQVCDDLVDILRDQQKNKIVQYFKDIVLQNQSSQQSNQRAQRIVEFFNNAVDECMVGRYEGYESSLINVLFQQSSNDWGSQCDDYKQLKSSISAFLISFTINVLEILGGSMSLIIRQLAKDVETQEKIRNNDKVEFNLEGFPFLNLQNTVKSTLSNSIIKEALENHPVDPITPFICKYPYRIPETKILVNPTCVILVPRHVLRNIRQIDCEGKWPERATPSGGFIVDLETESFNLFVEQFVEICLKLSVTSLLQEYEFTSEEDGSDRDDEIASTSCRFTTLPSDIFVNVSRVDKRGKVITFEESLKAFHSMKNAPLSWRWRTILSKWFPNTLVISS